MKLGNFNISSFWIKLALFGVLIVWLVSTYASFNNREVDLRTEFDMQMNNRAAFFQRMYTIIAGKGKVAVKFDSSFQRNIAAIMNARQDGDQIFMKWIQESNPNADVRSVQELYKDLSATIEKERIGFYERETTLSSIQREHTRFLHRFPNSLYNSFMGRKELAYKPISSDRTEDVMRTGRDNNVDPFN